ncbi:MAG TPA: SRPBCC domain-containing protein [Caulobacteraceae bacterium]|jgi:uncharacterized protein YndB with AHSA1/START domain|nr:SRPBCC domain-containing protein [Caulobacteraceae bacterium]
MANAPEIHERAELTQVRVLDAPRDVVFRAWTAPAQMAAWWGPKGFSAPVCEMDARPGGRIFILMRGPDGEDHPMAGRFEEVAPPDRLVFTGWPEDGQGNRYAENHVTVTFEDEPGGKTRMTVVSHAVAFVPMGGALGKEMDRGWNESYLRLDALLMKDKR